MAGAAARRTLLLAQYKPFSFLSPSTAPRGSKLFAVDLLTQRNLASAAPWVAAQGRQPARLTPGLPQDPRDLAGLVCIGRLDADSIGLMLWTTDAVLASRVMSPASHIEKEYLVRVTGHEAWNLKRREKVAQEMSAGLVVGDVSFRPCSVHWLNESQLQIILTEGKHRQARLMCASVGLEVVGLKRVRIGCIRLGGLRIGQWCWLPDSLHRRLSVETRHGSSQPRVPAKEETMGKQTCVRNRQGGVAPMVPVSAPVARGSSKARMARAGDANIASKAGRILDEVVI